MMSAIVEFSPVVPVGARSCCDLPGKSGAVQHVWLDSEVPDYAAEEAKLTSGDLEPRLTHGQHLDALAIFRTLKARAGKGQLRVEPSAGSPAKVMSKLWYLIELVPKLSKGAPPPRLFRLYYAEPESVQGALLPLVLSTKPNFGDPNGEQNASIDDAAARSRVWTLTKALEGTGSEHAN